MVSIFQRRGNSVDSPRVRPRALKNGAENVNRVALGELTPDPTTYLGRAAYLQLSIFETAARAVATAPTIHGKNAMSTVAKLSMAKYEGLIHELHRTGHEPGATMEPYTRDIDRFQRVTVGSDWYENLVTCYVTAGLLDDFFMRLAGGLPSEQARRVTAVLGTDIGNEAIVKELREAIAANPQLASRLAMWGRRLVGDTLLVARSALAVPENTRPDEARLEPVFTELIAAHTRRMDALGLTA
ncbi:ferritin-like fold-containing protein [Marisediminicola senii]|uniref:ferritin-like fold-containing protein n=1 Tax=Marisediminicola senii TaxID=2711233 RepID=UPI0013EA8B8F|nr:ferritin-like fold-containing protein [Marisediminicola senii]